MLTFSRVDLTPFGSLLQGVGIVYWVVVFGAVIAVLAKAQTWRGRVVGTALVVVILVGPLAVYVGQGLMRHSQAQARFDESNALFQQRCKTAGERIHKIIDKVDGVVWMKWRQPFPNHYDQFKLNDPYGTDCGGDGCILQLLRVTRGSERNPAAANRHNGAYRFVESTDPTDGNPYRYEAWIKSRATRTAEEIEKYKKNTNGVDPGPDVWGVALERTRIDRYSARYGVTWDDISAREDREHWIAGGSLKVIDLQTNEVIAERIGYMMDAGQGYQGGGRQPWTFAVQRACPEFSHDPGESRRGRTLKETSDFVFKVLNPIKED